MQLLSFRSEFKFKGMTNNKTLVKIDAQEMLKKHGLKCTKIRVALLNNFINAPLAQSYLDLKKALNIASDKSTVYRNLNVFEKEGLIHSLVDGKGVHKYAFGTAQNMDDAHPHFECSKCHKTFCANDIIKYEGNYPKGFRPDSINMTIKGLCDNC